MRTLHHPPNAFALAQGWSALKKCPIIDYIATNKNGPLNNAHFGPENTGEPPSNVWFSWGQSASSGCDFSLVNLESGLLSHRAEEVRKAIHGIRRQARGEESQRVAELEEGLKKLEKEMRPRSIDELHVMRDFEEECEEKVTTEGGGEICGKGKGTEERENTRAEGKNSGEKEQRRWRTTTMSSEEADKEKESTREPRWADSEEEGEEEARKEQYGGSDEDQEGHERSAGGRGERCEVCGRVEVWSEESGEQEGRGERGEAREARGEKETEEMRKCEESEERVKR